MKRHIGLISLMVEDYDAALDFYLKKLDFELVEDTPLSETKRWVVIKPKTAVDNGCSLLLAKAATTTQQEVIGNQSGGRVFLFLYTDDLDREYKNLRKHGVSIIREPKAEAYGKVLVFSDLYGNLWDLIEKPNALPGF